LDFHTILFSTLKNLFPIVRPYYAYIPSFDVPWAFLLCAFKKKQDPIRLTAREADRRIRNRLSAPLHFLDGTTLEGLFRVPKYMRELLSMEKRKNTLEKPAYFFK